jgi:hypothetical protein
MKRLRLIAGLLGCLAVLVAGFSVVAAAPLPTQMAASAPCEHCPDCNGVPCAPALAGCTLACATVPALLPLAAAVLPSVAVADQRWPASAILRGLTRPPDPFPPRA